MPEPGMQFTGQMIRNALGWFLSHLRQTLISPIESQFPNYRLTREVQDGLDSLTAVTGVVEKWAGDPISFEDLLAKLSGVNPTLLPLFKRIILLYRRDCAVHTERYSEKTFHLELSATLEEEVKTLDALANAEGFAVHRISAYASPQRFSSHSVD